MPTAYIALGSNIDPEENLAAAAVTLRDHFPTISFSSVYQSPSLLQDDQDDYLNAACKVETDLSAEEVHSILQSIEASLQKDVTFEWGPRTIDLDLLLFGDTVLPNPSTWSNEQRKTNPSAKLRTSNEKLTLPHPRMHERAFVLEPLCELIDPDARHPVVEIS